MNWKLLAVALLALPLVGCNTDSQPPLVRERLVAVVPNEALYKCPGVPAMPDLKTLTDVQTARYIVKIFEAHGTCRASLLAVKAYIAKAEKQINSQP